MLTVFSDAGFPSQRNFDLGTVVLTLATGATDESTARADAREFQAEARSLATLLRPALGGRGRCAFRRDRHRGHGAPLDRRRPGSRAGWSRSTRRASELAGVAAVPVAPGVRRTRRRPGRDLRARQSGAGRVARRGGRRCSGRGDRVVGLRRAGRARAPGRSTTSPRSPAPTTSGSSARTAWGCCATTRTSGSTRRSTTPCRPPAGLAVASQSGGVGIVLMDLARELELGVHTFVSLGNKADVSEQRPAGGLVRRPRGHRGGALPRVVRQRGASSPGSPAASPSASRCSPSSAAGPQVAAGRGLAHRCRSDVRRRGRRACSPRPA